MDDKEEKKLRKYVQEGELKAFKTFEEQDKRRKQRLADMAKQRQHI